MESDNRLSYKSLSFALLLVVGMCAAPSIAATTNKKDVTPIEQKIKDFPIKGKKGKASSRSYEVSVPAGSVGDYNVSISLDIDWKELGKETWMWIKSASRTMFSEGPRTPQHLDQCAHRDKHRGRRVVSRSVIG